MNSEVFKELIVQKGYDLYRDMPWRNDTRPYYVLVSELMLQQTQVDRVIPKFEQFIERFPDEEALASTPLSEVLKLWSGLGYNRRAKYLHDSAKMVTNELGGNFPSTYDYLIKLPGVGPNTAGAILAYAYNQPIIFIETNVRTVYFHHYFTDGDKISDTELRDILEETIDKKNPREFYWALMDYGSWLKQNGLGRIRQSKHYKKQSALKGSVREIRGQIIRVLTKGDLSMDALKVSVMYDERFDTAVQGLVRDGLVVDTKGYLHLTK